MADLKRLPIKYIRDRSKAAYAKGSECRICGTTEELEFHHFSSMQQMLVKWLRVTKITMETAEDAFEHRDAFIEAHRKEIYEDTATLCKKHHAKLHSVYGKSPSLATAQKQARWVEKQREKHGMV